VQGASLLDTRHEQIPTAAAAIKTMVLVQQDLDNHTQQAPGVAVLLLAGHKVDLRAAAQHLQLPKGSLRLATAEEAEAITGYELGCIPPLGKGVVVCGSLWFCRLTVALMLHGLALSWEMLTAGTASTKTCN
jgi:hypothetical protein